MADEPEAPGTAEGAGRRKRPAPTIDLTATEVKSEVGAEAQAEQAADAEPSSAADPAAEPETNAEENRTRTTGVGRAMLASGVVGGAVVAAVLVALWFADVLPVRGAGGSGAAARIAQLEAQVRQLSAPKNGTDDAKAIGDLSQRVGKIESALAKRPAADPALGERLTAAENSLKSLGVALTALTRRSDDIAAAAKAARERADAAASAVAQLQTKTQNASPAANKDEIAALNKRIAGLEQAVKATTVSDRAARLALSAASLRDAVARGEPFAAQLAEVKSLGGEAKMLAPLQPFAAAGVPSAATLAHELSEVIPAMQKASGVTAANDGFLARLQANARNLVHVRPVDAPAGDEPGDILTRVEVEASRNDVAGALKDLARLPADTRAPAEVWMKKAKARQAAIDASRKLAADTAAALGKR